MVKQKVVLSLALAFLLLSVTTAFSQVAPATQFYFPQVAVGESGGAAYETAYVLINPGSTAAQVTIEFFDDAGSPLSLEFFTVNDDNLGRQASVNISVAPNTTLAMSADNGVLPDRHTCLPLKTGSARVTSSVPIWGLSMFLLHSNCRGYTTSAVGVPPVTPSQQWTVFALRESVDVGIAVANPSDAAMTLTATLFDTAGVQLAQAPISLVPRGHTAKFTREMFPNVPPPFVGKIVITAATPFVMMSLYFDGTVMTSLPVFQP